MGSTTVSGTEPGQRQLNGPQTTGREYRNLSEPRYRIEHDINVAIPVRDGVSLSRRRPPSRRKRTVPSTDRSVPYPRQIQDLGGTHGLHRSRGD